MKFGNPETIFSDQGRQFIQFTYKRFLKEYNTGPILTSSYNPTGNSILERINGKIDNILRISKVLSFEDLLLNIYNNLNLTVDRNNKMSLYKILYMKDPFNLGINIDQAFIKQNYEAEKQSKIIENEKHNRKRANLDHYIGKYGFVKKHSMDMIEDKWKRLFQIHEVSNCNDRILVDDIMKKSWNNIKNANPFPPRGKENIIIRR